MGAYQYNLIFDVAKITIPSSKAESIEVFSIAFKEKKNLVQMVLAWGSTRIKIPIKLEFKELYTKFKKIHKRVGVFKS